MYKKIRAMPNITETFKKELLELKYINDQEISEMTDSYNQHIKDSFEKSKTFNITIKDITNENFKGQKSLTHKWKG